MVVSNDPSAYFKLQSRFEQIPFTQSEAWFNYLKAQGKRIVFFMDDAVDPVIMTWGFTEKIPMSGLEILRIEGECYRNPSEDKIREFYSHLGKMSYSGIELNSNNNYNVDFEVNVRRAGFVRPIGTFTCPLTIIVDLEKEIDYNRNWKRNVKTAVQEHLSVAEIEQPSHEVVQQIVGLFKEMAELKNLGYSLTHTALKELLQSKGIRTFMVYDAQQVPLAARIIHVVNGFSADVFAANSNRARECGATFFMMQYLFEQLKSEGIKRFDFSRIPPSNHTSDSVYLFKNSTRGEKTQYNGEWVRYKRKRTELTILAYKWFKLKKQRY